jgi:hypothetical protein
MGLLMSSFKVVGNALGRIFGPSWAEYKGWFKGLLAAKGGSFLKSIGDVWARSLTYIKESKVWELVVEEGLQLDERGRQGSARQKRTSLAQGCWGVHPIFHLDILLADIVDLVSLDICITDALASEGGLPKMPGFCNGPATRMIILFILEKSGMSAKERLSIPLGGSSRYTIGVGFLIRSTGWLSTHKIETSTVCHGLKTGEFLVVLGWSIQQQGFDVGITTKHSRPWKLR